jgi:uncharacterized protein
LFWFEIPVSNFERARGFYQTVMGIEIPVETTPLGNTMGQFPDRGGVGGAITYEPGSTVTPCRDSVRVYLVTDVEHAEKLARVQQAGGQVVADYGYGHGGYSALIVDTEGNDVGLFTPE